MIIRSPGEIKDFLKRHKCDFERPEVYLGQEPNSFHRDWKGKKLKILLVWLARYEDWRGNQSIPLIYQTLGEWRKDIIVERACFPNSEEDYRLFRDYKIPIFGLESKHSLGEYDIVAASLSFLPPWLNFPLMLEMSGIPVLWKERGKEADYPLLMVGGSAMYGNFSIAYPVVDVIYFGDAEEEGGQGLLSLLKAIIQDRNLFSLQKQFDYIFVPSLYTPVYKKEKFLKWKPNVSDLQTKFRRQTCMDLDKAPKYTKPILSYTDTSMGLGEVELSRGCRGLCSFCGIGWKYRPYRERSWKVMLEAMEKNKKWGGTWKGLCPIATEFGYYSQKRRLIKELSKISAVVDPLSMRVDAFVSDREFDIFLSKLGMNQLALGVEGISQRIRNRMLKGVTEEDILGACRIAIESGRFKRIKLFMISNVDETEEDYEEFFALLQKIALLKGGQHKPEITLSFTPLFIEPCTPLQWKHPTIERRQPWGDILTQCENLGIALKKKSGAMKHDENFLWVMQGMHLGDTRFATAVAKASEELKAPYYVKMNKGTKGFVTKWMKEFGYKWEYLLRERGEDEAFPWDVVDRQVPKKSLLSLYRQIEEGKLDEKSIQIKPKIDSCVIPKVPQCDEQLARGDAWRLVKYQVEEGFDTVPNSHWRAQIQRAAWLSDIPIATNQIRFFSDRDSRNWYEGFDYFVLGFKDILSDPKVLFEMNDILVGIKIVASTPIRVGRDLGKWVIGKYHIYSDLHDWELEIFDNEFTKKKKLVTWIYRTRYYSGKRKFRVDIRPFFVQSEIGTEGFKLYIRDSKVWIREFLKEYLQKPSSPGLSGVSFSRILKYKVVKESLCVLMGGLAEEIF